MYFFLCFRTNGAISAQTWVGEKEDVRETKQVALQSCFFSFPRVPRAPLIPCPQGSQVKGRSWFLTKRLLVMPCVLFHPRILWRGREGVPPPRPRDPEASLVFSEFFVVYYTSQVLKIKIMPSLTEYTQWKFLEADANWLLFRLRGRMGFYIIRFFHGAFYIHVIKILNQARSKECIVKRDLCFLPLKHQSTDAEPFAPLLSISLPSLSHFIC
jgi:hypothetical protein